MLNAEISGHNECMKLEKKITKYFLRMKYDYCWTKLIIPNCISVQHIGKWDQKSL